MPITPGTLGGMGRMPGSMGGGQFGGAAGSMGGPQNQNAARRRRFTGAPQGSGQITPGVLGGMGTVPGSASPITPGAIGDPAWRQGLGNRFDAAVGSMSQPSPITPGVLGGGGVAPTFNPTGSGQFGGAWGAGIEGVGVPMHPGPTPPPPGPGPPSGPGPGPGPGPDPHTDDIPGSGQFGGAFGGRDPAEPPVTPQRSMPIPYTPPPQMGAPPPPDGNARWDGSRWISSPGFPGAMRPGPGQGFEGQFTRFHGAFNPAGQFGSRERWVGSGDPLGGPPMRPYTGGFPGRPPVPPRGLPRRPPGMFPGGPQIPLNGGPPRYPAGHPMGGGMGQMARYLAARGQLDPNADGNRVYYPGR